MCVCVCHVLEIVRITSKCDFSPFDALHSVELATRRRYCSRQLNVLLSASAVLKGNIIIVTVIFSAPIIMISGLSILGKDKVNVYSSYLNTIISIISSFLLSS